MLKLAKNQQVHLPILSEKNVSLVIKREDLLHPLISGNKFRKLKYNIKTAKKEGFGTILTFGGAFSNHIAATAYAGKKHRFNSIGIIRGDELSEKWQANPTLKVAYEHGMRFKFVSREDYRKKASKTYLKQLQEEFGPYYYLPEGGTNPLAVQGCEEIIASGDTDFDFICCSVGTGGTLAGLVNASHQQQRVLGFLALKGDFIKEDIRKFAKKDNWGLLSEYHFGGYAKVTAQLIEFINDFRSKTQIPIDPIYTGKMIFGILDLVKKDYFRERTKVLAIHTGGLQGIVGMNTKLKINNLPLVHV